MRTHEGSGPVEAHPELDEVLELLYHLRERHQLDMSSLKEHRPSFKEALLAELERQGLVALEADRITLTSEGFQRAEQIIRRHRLAERLLTDVLHMNPDEVEQGACEFEHMVAEEITESICILLGHPRTCPHGSPIPPGECCRASAREVQSAAVPLTEVPVGTRVRIAYVSSGSDERQHRLAHLGIVPGAIVKVHQLKPSVVLVLDNSRLAMEQSVARDILVWRRWHHEPQHKPDKRTRERHRSRWRFRFWRR